MPLITFSGLASGIDSDALIQATEEARRAQKVQPLEEKVAELEDQNSALDELSSLFASLKDIIYGFTTANGGIVEKTADSSDETIVTATASKTAATGSYELTVSQLAANATFSFDDRFATTTDPINSSINDATPDADRTVSFTIGTGSSAETIDIVLTSTTTPEEFVSNFNDSSTKAVATLVNVGTTSSPSYAIVITSNDVGTELGSISDPTVGTEISSAGSFTTWTKDQAVDAQFSISGISGTITRSSNKISDVIPGVTFSLEDTGGPVTINVGVDKTATIETVQEFIDKYNEIVDFLAENNKIERIEEGENVDNVFSPLASISLDDNALSSVKNDMIGATYSSGVNVKIFADVGITTDRDGSLLFDTTKLEEQLDVEPNSVDELFKNFADTSGTTNGTIDQYVRFNGLFDTTINNNDEQISDLNDRIARAEASIQTELDSIRATFARLESTIAGMQNDLNALSSILPGVSAG